MIANCERCGAEFEKTRETKRFCSRRCRRAASSSRRKKKGKERLLRQVREKRHQRVGIVVLECLYCGKPVSTPPDKRGPKVRYCGPACREAYRLEVADKELSDVACPVCGKLLTRGQVSKGTTHCSSECCHATALRNSPRECVICGNEFPPKYQGQECCSVECAREKTYQTLREKTITVPCHRCGADVDSMEWTGAIGEHRYCPACKIAVDRDRAHRRRARKRGLGSVKVDRLAIFERDNWTCQLCGGAIDPDCPWPDPGSPSIDHIVPISKGGRHAPSNVQAAHLGCNSSKGNSLEEVKHGT